MYFKISLLYWIRWWQHPSGPSFSSVQIISGQNKNALQRDSYRRFSGHLSCHACPLPCTPLAMHTLLPHMPPVPLPLCHAHPSHICPLLCTPPPMYAPCYAHPLPCMPPAMHTPSHVCPLLCTPPPMYAPDMHIPAATHAPCQACPLLHPLSCHACHLSMHSRLPHMCLPESWTYVKTLPSDNFVCQR